METPASPRQIFPPETSSVHAARGFVRSHLADLYHPDVLWSAVQLVSELATNAVLHARTTFSVAVLSLADGAVRIEVTDSGDAIPRMRRYGGDATTGRGVTLVAALSREWGVEKLDGGGKVVWCEIVDDAPTLTTNPLTDGATSGQPNGARVADISPSDGSATTAAVDRPVIATASGVLMARDAA